MLFTIIIFLDSFIRLCDYLVVTMLHNLAVTSASTVLDVLCEQTAKNITVSDLVTEIPDDIEEQEKMLQVCHLHIHVLTYDCIYKCPYSFIIWLYQVCTCKYQGISTILGNHICATG